MGVPTDYFGFLYLEEAVLIAMSAENVYGLMTKNIYPGIAKAHKKTPASVEKNIRTAINYSWAHASPSALAEVFGNTARYVRRRPTAIEFISAVKYYLETN